MKLHSFALCNMDEPLPSISVERETCAKLLALSKVAVGMKQDVEIEGGTARACGQAVALTETGRVYPQWQHVDTTARTLYLPDTKNERSHTIHLSDFAVKQIEALFALREHGKNGTPVPWVFPSNTGEGSVCVKSFGKQLADRQRTAEARLKNRSKATQALTLLGGRWTAHDLRRTAATLMAGLGISTDVIDECLNHRLQSKVARVYIKDRRLPEQARAFDALGARLDGIVSGTAQPSNVISLVESRNAA